MALTLTEGNKYSTTELQGYVIDRLSKESELLQHLQFEELLGNSLTYDTIVTRSGANFYSVGDTWVEDTPVMSQNTVTLKILGGDADVDNFLLETRSNKLDLQGTVLDDKVVATSEKFRDGAWYGAVAGDAKSFDGMQALMTSTTYNTVHAGATDGSALSIVKLQQAIDLVTGFKPTHLFMSKGMRRSINVYLDSIGDKFTASRDQYGNMIEHFRGLKVTTDDSILDTETASSGAYSAKTGGDNTTIFIVTFHPQGMCGVQGKNGVQTVPLGDLETKDAKRWRIKWYCGLKFENLRSCAKVDGITQASTVTA